MGKGDKRSKRGKLFKGSFGKRRMKAEKVAKKAKPSGTGHS
jgi:30S ribosomal protein S31